MRIVYFDLDSLRPDHISGYGYPRETTPNLDRVLREGTRFTRAYCNSSPCMPSRASFVSGRYGINHGVGSHWGPGSHFRFPGADNQYSTDAPLLPRHLQQHGYRTATFSSFADRHLAPWFLAGWTETHNTSLERGAESAEQVNRCVLPWLEQHGHEEDFFIHVQYWDVHRTYTVDERYAAALEADPVPAWPDAAAIRDHAANYGPFSATEMFPNESGRSPVPSMPDRVTTREEFQHLVNGYDGALRYLDERIGEVLDTLDGLGVLDSTAVIISADHGEALGEQGIYGDHVCAGEAVHNIPMVVRWPDGARPGVAVDDLVYNVDLQPTICELLGIEVPAGWDGRSFAAALGQRERPTRSHLVWDHALYSCQRAVRTDSWLFIRTYQPGLFPFDEEILYDLAADPHQTTNLADEHPEVVTELDAVMQQWVTDNLARTGGAEDPLLAVARAGGPYRYVAKDAWLDRLRSEGRDTDVEDLCRRVQRAEAALTEHSGAHEPTMAGAPR